MRSKHATRGARTDPLGATRTVMIRRWVASAQIEQGMYVLELDRPWIETSFIYQGFRVDSQKTLDAVREACEHALVETEKRVPVTAGDYRRRIDAGWPAGAHA